MTQHNTVPSDGSVPQGSAGSKVDALLQRFPGPVVLRSRSEDRQPPFLSCMLFLGLAVLGISHIVKGDGAVSDWLLVAASGSWWHSFRPKQYYQSEV
jgi:hypothetical protein